MRDLLHLVFLLCASYSCAQIAIEPYPRKFSCEVDATHTLDIPKATSSCGSVKSGISEAVFSGGCLGTLVRTIVFTDECGQTATAEQYIQLTDNLGPDLIGVPSDLVTEESKIPPASLVSARDNSGELVGVEFSERMEGSVIVRTWTSIDPCGNLTSAEQKITVTGPTLSK